MVGNNLQLSGVESHNSIGSEERYHDPLRRVFNKITSESPKLDREIALRLYLKAINENCGPDGFVPSFLIFGVRPRFPNVKYPLPTKSERMNAIHKARLEMETTVSQLRIRKSFFIQSTMQF